MFEELKEMAKNKRLLKMIRDYYAQTDEWSCGRTLMEYINPDLRRQRGEIEAALGDGGQGVGG